MADGPRDSHPGTRITLGLDALLGLFPLGGDVLTGLVQVGLVLVASSTIGCLRTSRPACWATCFSTSRWARFPLLGDLFDVAFKANTRNLKLLEPYGHGGDDGTIRQTKIGDVHRGDGPTGRAAIELSLIAVLWRYLLPIAAILVVTLVLTLIGVVTVFRWIAHS